MTMAIKNKKEMIIDFATKASKELESEYHIGKKEIDEIRSLQGRKLEERIAKIYIHLHHHKH